jgi:hypothetical protein
MKKHTLTYFNHFGYDISDSSLARYVEQLRLTSITLKRGGSKGMGGSKIKADNIENLQALCRACHIVKFWGSKAIQGVLEMQTR